MNTPVLGPDAVNGVQSSMGAVAKCIQSRPATSVLVVAFPSVGAHSGTKQFDESRIEEASDEIAKALRNPDHGLIVKEAIVKFAPKSIPKHSKRSDYHIIWVCISNNRKPGDNGELISRFAMDLVIFNRCARDHSMARRGRSCAGNQG